MTRIEADICMKKGYPVHIEGNNFKADAYEIISAHKYKHKLDKTWQYSFGISEKGNWRSSVTVTADVLHIDEKFKELLQQDLETYCYSSIKQFIKELLAAGGKLSDIKKKVMNMLKSGTSDNPSVSEADSSLYTREPKRTKKQKKDKPFKKPTFEEVAAYIKEKGYPFTAEQFYNHYESNGWMVGKVPMKSWKHACGTWKHNSAKFGNNSDKLQGSPSFDINKIEQDALMNDDYNI